MSVFELRPFASPDKKDLEKDHRYQEELNTYLGRLDETEALRESDEIRHLASMSLEQTKTVTSHTVERVMFDACVEDLQRRGVGDDRMVQAMNNYLQYADRGNILDERASDIAITHEYHSKESQVLEQKIEERKIELLSKLLGNERTAIDGLHDHLDSWWHDETTKEEIRTSEKTAMKSLQTRGPHEFLAAAEMIANTDMSTPVPGQPTSLAALRQRVETKKRLTEAREAMEATMRGGDVNVFSSVGGRGGYIEGMAQAGRDRMNEIALVRARVRIQAIRGECLNYFRGKNLRLQKSV